MPISSACSRNHACWSRRSCAFSGSACWVGRKQEVLLSHHVIVQLVLDLAPAPGEIARLIGEPGAQQGETSLFDLAVMLVQDMADRQLTRGRDVVQHGW